MEEITLETTVADFVKQNRERLNVSMSKLSKVSGVGQATISETENGISVPRLNTLTKLLSGLSKLEKSTS